MITWVAYVAVGLIVGGAVGFFIGRLDDFSKKQREAMQEKIDQAEKELSDYKHEVAEHFIETADLVNAMTESYQAVHEHLAKGAQSLCDDQVKVNRLQVMTEALESAPAQTTEQAVPIDVEPVVEETTTEEAGQTETAATTTETSVAIDEENIPTLDQTVAQTEPQAEAAETEVTQTDNVAPVEEGQEKINAESATVVADAKSEEEAALSDQKAAAMASRMVH